jgi:hypothetical protein
MQKDFTRSANQAGSFIKFIYEKRKECPDICSLFIDASPDFAKCNLQINFPHSEVSDIVEGGIY